MAIQVIDNFDVFAAKPIDSRSTVADLTARDALNSSYRYEGMEVYVLSEEVAYRLQGGITNGDWVAAATAASVGWVTSGNDVYPDISGSVIIGGATTGSGKLHLEPPLFGFVDLLKISHWNTIKDVMFIGEYGYVEFPDNLIKIVNNAIIFNYFEPQDPQPNIAHAPIDVRAGGTIIRSYGGAAYHKVLSGEGAITAITPITSGHNMGGIQWHGQYDTSFGDDREVARISAIGLETYTVTNTGSEIRLGVCDIGANTIVNVFRVRHDYINMQYDLTVGHQITAPSARVDILGNDLAYDYLRVRDTNSGGFTPFSVDKLYPKIASYAAANLPTTHVAGAILYINDEFKLAYNDGSKWRRLGFKERSRTTTTNAVDRDVIFCDATGGAFDVDLPDASVSAGVQIIVKKTDASGAAITIDPGGSDTIDGAASASLASQYDVIWIVCDGNEWFRIV